MKDRFVNISTLNIFCDASIRPLPDNVVGCYGALATINDTVVDSDYRICTKTTNNESEIKAIRLGVDLAIRLGWKKTINIFSDSLTTILGLRERIYSWRIKHGVLDGSGNAISKNQSLFIEIINMIVNNNLRVNFFHQKAHINIENYSDVNNAIHVFMDYNGFRDIVDVDFIRFISTMNNIVDQRSRKLLYTTDGVKDTTKQDAITFSANNTFRSNLSIYNKLQGGKYYVRK
jgi:ribonuclease HI